jgi:proteasome lid subunit RPN8/RPN11
MLLEITNHLPEEACGLLAGKDSQVSQVLPVENVLHSPVRYRMNPNQQLAAIQLIENQNLELLAIYHSHPEGPATPSATDVAEAYYPEVVHIIISRLEGVFTPRGFIIHNGQSSEILLEYTE